MLAVLASAGDGDGNLGRGSLGSDTDAAGQSKSWWADLLWGESLDAVQAVVITDGAEDLFRGDLLRQALFAVHLGAGRAVVLVGGGAGGEASLKRSAVRATLSSGEVVLDKTSGASVSVASGAVSLGDISRTLLALASLLDDVHFGVGDGNSHAWLFADQTTEDHAALALLEGSAVICGGSPAATLGVLFESRWAILLLRVGGNVDGGALWAFTATDLAYLDQRQLFGRFATGKSLQEASRAVLLSGLADLGHALLALLGGSGWASCGLGGLDDAFKALEGTLVADDLSRLSDGLLAGLALESETEGTGVDRVSGLSHGQSGPLAKSVARLGGGVAEESNEECGTHCDNLKSKDAI